MFEHLEFTFPALIVVMGVLGLGLGMIISFGN
jgi:hypothetical protein